MAARDESGEARPSVAAYFADLDKHATPFLTALGQVVVAAAALENNLQLELARLLKEEEPEIGSEKLDKRLAELRTLTAGKLLGRLRERGLPEDLQRRIDDAVDRRNQLVHHLYEDPVLLRAVMRNEPPDDAIGQLQGLALDCAGLSVELQMFALAKIEDAFGGPKQELLDAVLSLDPEQIADPAERNLLEAAQALKAGADWSGGTDPTRWDHRITVDWMGEQIETLADLLRPGLRAVCIGINPSPVSVEAGHYYQGRIGRRFWQRLRQAGVINDAGTGREDDAAFISGIGFTDIVKRPTPRAEAISAAEFDYGREALAERLRRYKPSVLIFAFKKPAVVLFGRFDGCGFRPDLELSGAQVFVMPGPYERKDRVAAGLEALRDLLFHLERART